MANLKILVWENREPQGEPDVEVKIPTSMARWLPRMMRLVPKKTKAELWGEGVDYDSMIADIESMVKEMEESGQKDVMEVKSKGSNVKILIEK